MGNQMPPLPQGNPSAGLPSSQGIGVPGGRPVSPAEEFGALNYVQDNIMSGGPFPPAGYHTPDQAVQAGIIPAGIGKGG